MQDLGFGRGYRYAHDFAGGVVAQQNLPDNLRGRKYYEPSDRGLEREPAGRLERIRAIYADPTSAESPQEIGDPPA
jgi:putative ATPase